MKSLLGGADPKSTAVIGGLTLIAMLLFFWISGALFPSDTVGTGMSSAQITGMALTYSTTSALLLASNAYMKRRTPGILNQLVQIGGLSLEGASSCGRHDVAMGLGRNVATTLGSASFFL